MRLGFTNNGFRKLCAVVLVGTIAGGVTYGQALYYKYGFDGAEERTIDDVAECLGVNHEKSRNLTAKVLRNLRKEGKVLQLYVK